MAEASATRRRPIRLKFTDGEVMVTPRDMDTFFISAERAAEVCREAVKEGERVEQFRTEFLLPLYRWCESHAARVRACYIPRPAANVQVFVVTTSTRYDFPLGEELAALELSLARAGWCVAVSQLPAADEASLGTFFNPDGALEVYAQSGSASDESAE